MPRGRYERHVAEPWETPGELVACGVDWLSLTGARGETAEHIRSLAERIVAAEIAAGWEERHAPMRRYRGFAAGGCAYGERPEDVMLQLSSTTAAKHFSEALPLARTVSRLDAQVTVEMPVPVYGVAREQWAMSQTGTGKKGRPPSADLVLNSTGGSTAYLGSPRSDRFVRVYDKGIESGLAQEGKLWRCEAVLRKDRARHAADFISRQTTQGHGAAAVCSAEIERKSGKPFWSSAGNQYTGVTGSPEPATVDRKLAWLSAQVAPSVAWLLTRTSRAAILEALGIPECSDSYIEAPPQS